MKDGKHWANEDVLTGRAFFRANDEPARLMIESVKEQDGGIYKCRVDFKKSPTKNTKVNLTVISEYFFFITYDCCDVCTQSKTKSSNSRRQGTEIFPPKTRVRELTLDVV